MSWQLLDKLKRTEDLLTSPRDAVPSPSQKMRDSEKPTVNGCMMMTPGLGGWYEPVSTPRLSATLLTNRFTVHTSDFIPARTSVLAYAGKNPRGTVGSVANASGR